MRSLRPCFRSVLWFVPLSVLAGCAGASGARLIQKDAQGGVVAIPNNTDCWPSHYRAQAEQLMAEFCPEGYVITHEEEVRVGRGGDGKRPANQRYEYDGALVKLDDTRSEYHIAFRRAAKACPAPGVSERAAPPGPLPQRLAPGAEAPPLPAVAAPGK